MPNDETGMLSESDRKATVNEVLARLAHEPGALLPIFHAIQEHLGYVPEEAIPTIAKALNQTRAEIYGTLTFYSDFRTAPPGDHILQICRAESCQAMGGRALEAFARETLRVDFGETTADGQVSLEPVYCLGNCACSPSVRIGEDIYGRVSPDRLDQLIGGLRKTETGE
jgi:formate dehydrogenase subunit gamma